MAFKWCAAAAAAAVLVSSIVAGAAASSDDTLPEIGISGVQERQRLERPPARTTNPDLVSVFRSGTTRVRLRPFAAQDEIRFRRGSGARHASVTMLPPMRVHHDLLSSGGGPRIRDVLLEFDADLDEADGLPAVISFGARTSLVNVDYLRLRDTGRPTLIVATNAINPLTRLCSSDVEVRDEGQDFSTRFLLLGDRLADCERAVRDREGDLFVADGVPGKLREDLRAIYEPVYNRFARLLGSEPGMTFVIWRPGSPRKDFQFERNWSRGSLLLFNGTEWLQGFSPAQREALWEAFATEQILRRLGWGDPPDAFTDATVSYLLLLAKSEQDSSTVRSLATQLPVWISACATQQRNARAVDAPLHRSGPECGLIVQFLYDAAVRAGSKGDTTVFDTWRGLLTRSFRRGDSGVEPQAFLGSSAVAQAMAKHLLEGSVDWPRFVEQLATLGVNVSLKPGEGIPAVEVLSLTHFRDQA